ncbi:hypothetical protein ACF3NA_03525 [Alkanindiges sp. WGS2144]|uniref:hypothetical protein n=1 Tax=Alkanindiges sp. WGS2144 TaxID=3366808 RepID=UPI0037500D01
MFKNWFKPKTIYVQVFKNQFKLYSCDTQQLTIVNGEFTHPRMLLGSFTDAEQLLKQHFNHHAKIPGLKSYRAIIHPKELVDGGLSDIEQRALRELFLGLGFQNAQIWQGQDLSDEQLNTFDWKNDH